MPTPSESLFQRIRWIVFILWAVAAVRLALDFRQQEDPIVQLGPVPLQLSIGVFYVAPLLLCWGSIRGTFAGMRYRDLTLAAALLAILCWGIPNLINYGTAQFLEWTHGRFKPGEGGRGPDIGTTTLAKLGATAFMAAATTAFGFAWCFIWMNLVVVLPRKVGAGRAAG